MTISLRALFAVLATLIAASPAAAGSNLFFGFSDDSPKFEPSVALAIAADLGVKAYRITLDWDSGQTSPSAAQVASLTNAVVGGSGMRIVLAVYADSNTDAPQDDAARESFCTYVRNVLTLFPLINDVVIWNEPNKQFFWKPQYNSDGSSAAPAAYAALVARCWDTLHAFRSSVNVIAPATSPRGNDRANAASNVSHSPGNFIRKMGEWFAASDRQQRMFDTVGHHAYGEHSAERPWKEHGGSSTISQGDWESLMQALSDGFGGTDQPIPGECDGSWCIFIWYLEMGYQTVPDAAKASRYSGTESDPHALVDDDGTPGWNPESAPVDASSLAPDQATQIVDGIRLAFCQPYVQAFFNLIVWDEEDLGRWQSGPQWADRSNKDSYSAFKQVIGEINADSVSCSALKGKAASGFTPSTGVEAELSWPKQTTFPERNNLWRFRVKAGEDASYVATLSRLGSRGTAAAGTAVSAVSGKLNKGFLSWVTFARKTLSPGTYEMEIVLTSKAASGRSSTFNSPELTVGSQSKSKSKSEPKSKSSGPKSKLPKAEPSKSKPNSKSSESKSKSKPSKSELKSKSSESRSKLKLKDR